MKYYLGIISLFILCGCSTLSHVEVQIETDSYYKVMLTEYDKVSGYIQNDVIYEGFGNCKIPIVNKIPQYLYVWNFSKDSLVTIYKVYKDGTREDVSKRMSTGAVEWWHILQEVSVEDLQSGYE